MMIKDDCGGVWLEWPPVITLFDDNGNERDYIPERTCSAILKEPRWGACECSVCGGALESFNQFCPNCGARVVAVDERTCKVVRYDAGGGVVWLTCSECGNIMPEHDNYCSSCGARVVRE